MIYGMKCTQYYKIHNITNISIYRYKKCSSSVYVFHFIHNYIAGLFLYPYNVRILTILSLFPFSTGTTVIVSVRVSCSDDYWFCWVKLNNTCVASPPIPRRSWHGPPPFFLTFCLQIYFQ